MTKESVQKYMKDSEKCIFLEQACVSSKSIKTKYGLPLLKTYLSKDNHIGSIGYEITLVFFFLSYVPLFPHCNDHTSQLVLQLLIHFNFWVQIFSYFLYKDSHYKHNHCILLSHSPLSFSLTFFFITSIDYLTFSYHIFNCQGLHKTILDLKNCNCSFSVT